MIEIKPLSHENEIKLLKAKLTKSIANIILAVIAIALLVASMHFIPNEVDFKNSELFKKVALSLIYIAYIFMIYCVVSFVFKTIKDGVLDIVKIRKVLKLDKQISEAIKSEDKNREVNLTLVIYDLMCELNVMSLNRKAIRSILLKFLNGSIEIYKFDFDINDNRLYCDYSEVGSSVVEKTSFKLKVKYVTTAKYIQTQLEQEQIILPYNKEYSEPIKLLIANSCNK